MRPGVDLLVHQVVQLEHVHHAHGDVLVERLAGAAVEEHHLARARQLAPRRTARGSRPRARRRTPAWPTWMPRLQPRGRASTTSLSGSASRNVAERRCRRRRSSSCLRELLAASSSPRCSFCELLAHARARPSRGASRGSARCSCGDGTPSGLSTMSTGRPSSRYGMSSSGRMRETTPLLPWRPAILSPTASLRLMATYTLTILMTPGGSSSPFLMRAIFSPKASFTASLLLLEVLEDVAHLGVDRRRRRRSRAQYLYGHRGEQLVVERRRPS